MTRPYYVVTLGYEKVEAASAKAAADIVATTHIDGEGRDLVVRTRGEAIALLAMAAASCSHTSSGSTKAWARP